MGRFSEIMDVAFHLKGGFVSDQCYNVGPTNSLWTTLKTILFSLLVILAVLVLSSSGQAQEAECLADDIRNVGSTGKLVISEFKITKGASNCPRESDNLGTSLEFRPGERVYMFFRLEGDAVYLRSPEASREFRVFVARIGPAGAGFDSFLTLDNSRLHLPSVNTETQKYGGRFDWRLRAFARAFYVPGTYTVTVFQGPRKICLAEGSSCSIVLEVQ